ncbi:MAG: hypothetical protein AB7V62_14500 [Thermoleophilia bacterium]
MPPAADPPPPPPPPDGVLVQSVYTSPEGVPAGWRVWEDGRHEGMRAGGDWTAAPRLSSAAVAEVRATLEGADLPAIAGAHHDPDSRPTDAVLWFQARLDEGPVAVGLVGSARLPELTRLTEQLVPLLVGS